MTSLLHGMIGGDAAPPKTFISALTEVGRAKETEDMRWGRASHRH